jgi:peptidoglycan hydrolase-like protein with peptidoglycan-binding domain
VQVLRRGLIIVAPRLRHPWVASARSSASLASCGYRFSRPARRERVQRETDGLFGPQTRAAIGRYQKSQGLTRTCYPSRQLYETLTGTTRTEATRKDSQPAAP